MNFINRQLPRRTSFLLIFVLILTAYQLIRVIAFANVYGGLEHDSGWFLGVSRSLAERGQYTAMVNTIVNPAVMADIDVDRKFNIQTLDGRIWFFTGNGTGPGSIAPNALVLKLFGTGFWALRSGPLIFYMLVLILTAYLLYQLTGLGAVILFHLFLFFYPRLTIFLSYEAEGEMAALVYIVAAYLLFAFALTKQEKRLRYFFLAGLMAGLAFNTKLLALLSVSGILLWAGWLWLSRSKQVNFRELLGLGGGLILPQAIWELVHWLILARLAGYEMYLRHAQQRLRFVLDDGSGLGQQIHAGPEFMWRKFFMLEEVAHPEHWVTGLVFTGTLLGGLYLIWLWRNKSYNQNILIPIWLGWLANTAWFVGMAKTGWPRHYWFGLILAVVLLCIISVSLVRLVFEADQFKQRKTKLGATVIGVTLLGMIAWGFGSQSYVRGYFLPDEIVPFWLEKRFDYVDLSGLPWILVRRADQAAVVDYISRMPPEANVYYPTAEFGHKAAEIPALTGRVNYPFNRRTQPGVVQHPADIVLIPPSVISIWRFAPITQQELLTMALQACPQPVLKNDSYIICLADQIRLP
jgi:hypothetical protein